MQEKKSALMSKLTKTLALGVPAVVFSGFVPLDSVSTQAAAEHHGSSKYSSEAKTKNDGCEAKAEAECEAEAEGEAK